jgi:hypothetical protein
MKILLMLYIQDPAGSEDNVSENSASGVDLANALKRNDDEEEKDEGGDESEEEEEEEMVDPKEKFEEGKSAPVISIGRLYCSIANISL